MKLKIKPQTKMNKFNSAYLRIIKESSEEGDEVTDEVTDDIDNIIASDIKKCPFCGSEDIHDTDYDTSGNELSCYEECNDCHKVWKLNYKFRNTELDDGKTVNKKSDVCPYCGSENIDFNDSGFDPNSDSTFEAQYVCSDCDRDFTEKYDYVSSDTKDTNY